MENSKNNIVNLEGKLAEAEKNARLRDLEIEREKSKNDFHGVDQKEIDQAIQTVSKAAGGKEVYFGIKKSPKSKVKFVQINQPNLGYLMEKEYFKSEEMKFLFRVMPYIAFRSNCIVDDINTKNAIPVTQVELAKKIGSSQPTVNRLVKQLIDKGIIAKAETGREGVSARSYALFLNPNIIYSGDRDDVNETLQMIFKKVNLKSVFKNLPHKIC
ncbi:winged helix-turn-helix transcriptional regulator (plasmid) [Bacillus sp. PK9-021]|uniref:winged helix-turn-helix transcriptional regulator n=1 Tax=Priestia megaterium TaxID=1404 RepID=UPI001EDB10A2|nr:winged helix-turn-helix transcriptional regulator [Priestia megaterium]MDH3161152.1 winged helix-turn-helix transcriptional regulator [Priestia megaterium]MDH3161161.1 winged helix-turn-helix transcriptional regulator [Priestia megaterium]MED4115676.1 winged helix-turn-helix transcriptional regulator [Priestia megaterium]